MTSSTAPTTKGLLLSGLDGSNPLGFLAALGTFRTLDSSIRMKWVPAGGTWVPAVYSVDGHPLEDGCFLDDLYARLVHDVSAHPVRVLSRLHDGEDDSRRQVLKEQHEHASCVDRMLADWLSALASDSGSASAINQLQTARRDYFVGNLTAVIQNTTIEHLRRAVFQVWDYADPLEKQSLHLDPSEDRRHAYQWNQPSGDPDRKKSGGMLGANRLAIEAIPFFLSVPENDNLHTLGFSGKRSTDTRWTWPIWNVCISHQVIQSLLALPVLQEERFSSEAKRGLYDAGIAAAFRTYRILVGKTPNFTPARRIV